MANHLEEKKWRTLYHTTLQSEGKLNTNKTMKDID